MKTSILLMVLIFTAVYVQSCCSGKKYIYITNNSTEKIYVAKTFTSPDTSISFPKSWLNVVLPSTSRDFPIGLCKEKDEEIFSRSPNNKMSVFFFNVDTLNKYTWEQVQQGYKILKRKDITLYELRNMNFNVSYP